MKQNAAAASDPLPGKTTWPPDADSVASMAAMPAASLLVDRLRQYAAELGEGGLEIHLAGHSAGSIFTANLLVRLAAAGVPVTSMTWLAPAIRVDDFAQLVLPPLRGGRLARFASFGLEDKGELDDVVGTGPLTIYHKSLLYLVSRGLETVKPGGEADVPLVGMQRYASTPMGAQSLAAMLSGLRAEFVWAPSAAPVTSRTSATSHGGFNDDAASMTSIMLRVLDVNRMSPVNVYRRNAVLAGS
ncbi:MAG: hypothetical protein WBX27_10830 [Specibacter sp.]